MRKRRGSFFFRKEGRKRSIYLEISPRGEREDGGFPFLLIVSLFLLIVKKGTMSLVYKRLFLPPSFTTVSIHQLARGRSIMRACNGNRFNGKKEKNSSILVRLATIGNDILLRRLQSARLLSSGCALSIYDIL